MSFWDDILYWNTELQKQGYSVVQYPKQISGEFLPGYIVEFTTHFQQMEQSDIIFILNKEKNGIPGYIGAAVFAEIAFAVGLNRTSRQNNPLSIVLLTGISPELPHYEELQRWIDLGWVSFWQ